MPSVNSTLGDKNTLTAHATDLHATQAFLAKQQITQRSNVKKIIIEGQTHAGRKFRPSDWAERMSGALSTFGRDQRIRYSPLLQPLTIDGVKCVALDPKLQDQHPEMFHYIMGWASGNDLIVSETDTNTLNAAAN